MNVKVKKFIQARVKCGSNHGSLREGVIDFLKEALYKSVDGCGLASKVSVLYASQCITDNLALSRGHQYIGAIHIRGNLIPTAARRLRGRPEVDIQKPSIRLKKHLKIVCLP